mmetsp:Transcript_63322/g.141141  ORF Transcript_63322/g.141141 Transcript_63322/m.141141 type:complete len:232 (-) Transcript_63322:398-1093(-)
MPRARKSCLSSASCNVPTPSHMMSLSSFRRLRMRRRSWNRSTAVGAKVGIPRKLQRETSCSRCIPSRVISSLNFFMTLMRSSVEMAVPPCRIRCMKLRTLSVSMRSVSSLWGVASFFFLRFSSEARCFSVWSRTCASSSRTCSSLMRFSSFWCFSSNVEGSRLGKSLRANGRANSMKGTRTKNASGTTRDRSASTRTSSLCSLRLSCLPVINRPNMRDAIFVSAINSLEPW